MSLRVIWQYMDRSKYCHMTLSAMNYLLGEISSLMTENIKFTPILFPHQSMYAMPNHLPIICQNLIIWKLSPRFTYPSEFGISVWRGSYIYIYICTKTGIIIYHWIAVTNIHVIQKVTLSKLYVKPYNIPTSLNEMSTIFMNQYFYSQIKMFHKTSRTIHPSDWEIKQKI